MANRIEIDIVESILHHPEYVERTLIKPEWFNNTNLRAIYQSIKAYPTSGTDKWYEIAKSYGFNGNVNQIAVMFDKPESIHSFKQFLSEIRSLEKIYLNRYIKVLAVSNQIKPSQKFLDRINNAIKQLLNVDSSKHTDQLKEAGQSMLYDLNHSKDTGIKSYSDLDHVLSGGITGGNLITLGAKTGVGKTAFAINLAYAIACRDPEVRIDYISLEMSARSILNRFISRGTGASNYELKDPYDRIKSISHRKNIAQITKMLIGKNSNIHVYDRLVNLDEILSVIRQNACQCKDNKYIVIIDYIGLINTNMNDTPRYLQIEQITRSLKILAESQNIPIIELAQLGRNTNITNQSDKSSKLSGFRESASIEEDSNVAILLYENRRLNKRLNDLNNNTFMTIDIAKNRDGVTSKLNYLFLKNRMTFLNKAMIKRNSKLNHPIFQESQVFKKE